MLENVIEIAKEILLGEVQRMLYEGHRFITATCVDNGNDTLDVLYHFDKEYELSNLRVTVKKGESIPSISKIYFSAVLVENEMKELFGLNVENMVLDYKGHMLLADDAPDTPMTRQQIVIEQKGAKKDG